MPGKQMLHQIIDLFVLAARKLAVLVERKVLGSANFSCQAKCGVGLSQDSIQRLAVSFCGHGGKLYNAAQPSQ